MVNGYRSEGDNALGAGPLRLSCRPVGDRFVIACSFICLALSACNRIGYVSNSPTGNRRAGVMQAVGQFFQTE
jgi:hypothetical protein